MLGRRCAQPACWLVLLRCWPDLHSCQVNGWRTGSGTGSEAPVQFNDDLSQIERKVRAGPERSRLHDAVRGIDQALEKKSKLNQ